MEHYRVAYAFMKGKRARSVFTKGYAVRIRDTLYRVTVHDSPKVHRAKEKTVQVESLRYLDRASEMISPSENTRLCK